MVGRGNTNLNGNKANNNNGGGMPCHNNPRRLAHIPDLKEMLDRYR